MTREEIVKIVEKVKSFQKNRGNTLPDNSYFLDSDEVLCYPRQYGDSRYPYYQNGLVLFAHTSGYIDCVKGVLEIFKCSYFNEDTPVAFFLGEKTEDGFFPISITGAARQLFEPTDIKRYTVYTPQCGYYIAETGKAICALKLFVDDNEHIHFSFGVINCAAERTIYLQSYFEPAVCKGADAGPYEFMSKYSEHFENGSYIIRRKNENVFNSLVIGVKINGIVREKHSTTAKKTVLGLNGANLTNALSMKSGYYCDEIKKTHSACTPCASDIIHFNLESDGFAMLEYELMHTEDYEKAVEFAKSYRGYDGEKSHFANKARQLKRVSETFEIVFEDWNSNNVDSRLLNIFLRRLKEQISFCAFGENYAGDLLGIRDVFQQLETALIWDCDAARSQIVRVLNYILDTGRVPRQISFPTQSDAIPKMDLRPFIDQGFWVIATLHTYLAYTDDKTILDEQCGYYKAENTYGPLQLSDEKDSVLCHLIRIMNFLISNIDEDTKCVCALFGDWNDALDALGKTKNPEKEFGNGVSVMATEQMYLALGQMCEIFDYCGLYADKIDEYRQIQSEIANGFYNYAVARRSNEVRVVHGWGENRTYYVGSFSDYDGKERISLTTNAYFAISGLSDEFGELCNSISKNILALDSRYGLLTFDKPFDKYAQQVGRLSTITPGTYENAAAYIHAGTFGIMALFIMGHSKKAWEILEKTMVITHKNTTRTTFIMPNSYCCNEEYSIDGDSMGDWYTGSGTVLVKNIIKYGFGIIPTLDGIVIAPPSYMPCQGAKMSIKVKGCSVVIRYQNTKSGKRRFVVNGMEKGGQYNELSDNYSLFIPNSEIENRQVIEIID